MFTHGEYSAVSTERGVRYFKNKKLFKKADLPPVVLQYFNDKFDSLVEAEEIEAPVAPAENSSETQENSEDSVKLTADDFTQPDATGEPLPRADEPVSVSKVDSDYLETISIHTADIKDIAQALYERFGIYTVYLGRYPQPDEVNPFTAEPMSNYERGTAYQAALRVEARGLLDKDPTILKKQLDDNIEAANNVRKSFSPVAGNIEEARAQNSFDYRTSVESTHANSAAELEHYTDNNGEVHVRRSASGSTSRQVFDEDGEPEEPVLEPNLGGAPIIRKDW